MIIHTFQLITDILQPTCILETIVSTNWNGLHFVKGNLEAHLSAKGKINFVLEEHRG